jgi:hypothetical protein
MKILYIFIITLFASCSISKKTEYAADSKITTAESSERHSSTINAGINAIDTSFVASTETIISDITYSTVVDSLSGHVIVVPSHSTTTTRRTNKYQLGRSESQSIADSSSSMTSRRDVKEHSKSNESADSKSVAKTDWTWSILGICIAVLLIIKTLKPSIFNTIITFLKRLKPW